MAYVVSLADLRRTGFVLDAHEVVAIALQLIHAPSDPPAQPPFGPLTPARVRVAEDGIVTCAGCDATPSVAELAIVMDALLRDTPHVPGGLRYALARAMHEVDAPPFDSLDEFASTLKRYAPHSLQDTVRRLVARSDRRRPASPSELRHELREADRRLYESRIRVGEAPPVDRRAHGWAAGALLAGALATIAAASVVGDRVPEMPAVAAPALAIRAAEPDMAREMDVHPVLVAPKTIVHSANPVNPKPPVHARTARARTLRLRWFHKMIAIKDDLTRP